MRRLIWCWCLSLFLAGPVAGATYYTSLTGSNSNPGTEALPFLGLTATTFAHLTPGDTLYIKAGTFTTHSNAIPSGTSWALPVTISGAPGESVILDNAGLWTFNATDHYIILQDMEWIATGFEAGGSSTTSGADHIRLNRIEAHSNTGTQVFGGVCEDCEFIDLNCHGNGGNDPNGLNHCIYIKSQNGLIRGGRYWNNTGHDIQLKGNDDGSGMQPHNWVIEGVRCYQTVSNTGRGCIYTLGGGHTFRNNVVYKYRCGLLDVYGVGNRIYNNTFYGLRNPALNGGLTNCADSFRNADISVAPGTILANNLFVGSGNRAPIRSTSGNLADLTQINNLVITTAANALFVAPNAGVLASATDNFALQAGSPARNTGATVASVTTDFAGVARPQPPGGAYDVGAYEYVTPGAPTFTFTVGNDGSPRTLIRGSTAQEVITVTVTSGTAEPISFTVAGLPTRGVTASFSPTSVTPTNTTTLTFTAASDAPSGDYTMTVTAQSSTTSLTTSFVLRITC